MFGGALPYILLSPLVVFIGALSFVPTVDTTVEAFFRVSPLNPPTQFTGLGNFRALFESIELDQIRRGVLKDDTVAAD